MKKKKPKVPVEESWVLYQKYWSDKEQQPKLKTKYKYIHFKFITRLTNRSKWNCVNNRSNRILGSVEWERDWKQFIFTPTRKFQTIYSASCLNDIGHFISQLNEKGF